MRDVLAALGLVCGLLAAQPLFTQRQVRAAYSRPWTVAAVDVDSDLDIDLVSHAYAGAAITWWENDGSQNWTRHVIDNTFDGVHFAICPDLDHDQDPDVLVAGYDNDDIAWYENDGSGTFAKHVIDPSIDCPFSIWAADVDSDGDEDVLAAAIHADEVVWYENDGGQQFTRHLVCGPYDGAGSVYAGDLDGDRDVDVIAAALHGGRVTWWEQITTGIGEVGSSNRQSVSAPTFGEPVERQAFDVAGRRVMLSGAEQRASGVCFIPDLQVGRGFVLLR